MHKTSFCVKCGQTSEMAKETLNNLPTVFKGIVTPDFGYNNGEIRPVASKPGHYMFSFETRAMKVDLELHLNGPKLRIKVESAQATSFHKKFKTHLEVTMGDLLVIAFKEPKKPTSTQRIQEPIVETTALKINRGPAHMPEPERVEAEEEDMLVGHYTDAEEVEEETTKKD